MKGKNHTEESNKKRSGSLKAKGSDWVSSEQRKEIGRKNSEKMKLLWQDPEYHQHMSDIHKGHTPWNKGKEMPPSWNKGKKLTEEHKAALRAAKARKRNLLQ